MVAVSMAMTAAGTILSNELLGHPIFENVIRNTAIAGMAVYAAVEIAPAFLNAFASGVAGSATVVALGSLPTPANYAAYSPGTVFLQIPEPLYTIINGASPALWSAINYGWLRYWFAMGANFQAVSPAANMVNQSGGLTGFGQEIIWLTQMGAMSSGRFFGF